MTHALRVLAQRAATLVLLALLLSTATGCGAIAAAANPKVAWALNDPAPMSVVVRRADAAEKTAQEVDRLLLQTPTPTDAAWLDEATPSKDDAQKRIDGLRAHPLYQATPVRIVAAEVWSDALPKVGKSKGKPADPTGVAPSKAEKTAKATDKRAKTPKGELAKGKAVKTSTTTVTSAPVATSAAGGPKSVLLAIDPELGQACEEIMALRREIGATRGKAAALEAEMDAKGVTAGQKATLRRQVKELEKAADALETKVSPKQKELIARAKSASEKAPALVRERVGTMLVGLRQAIEDASIANGAAAVRYPLAVPTLLDSTKAMVPVFVADVVEERTGKRPTMNGLQPGVTLEGGNVQITLNGLSSAELGQLSVGDVTGETVKRTQAWVAHALGLLGSIGTTKDVLSFQADLVDALLAGLKAGGFNAPPSPTMPEGDAKGAKAAS